jgi:hypothetical protein
LTDEERAEVEKLRRRDSEVRRHEQTHKAAAGQYASGGPTFEYQTGPDGRRYVVDGKVKIDTSEIEGDPQATIRKMQQVRRAALAPAQPSAQDRQVAAQAAAAERSAQEELARQPDDEAPGAGGLSEAPGLGREMSESPSAAASAPVAPGPAGPSKTADSSSAGNLAPRQPSPGNQAPLWKSAWSAQAAPPSGRFIDVAV